MAGFRREGHIYWWPCFLLWINFVETVDLGLCYVSVGATAQVICFICDLTGLANALQIGREFYISH